jgi:hypothetical protein
MCICVYVCICVYFPASDKENYMLTYLRRDISQMHEIKCRDRKLCFPQSDVHDNAAIELLELPAAFHILDVNGTRRVPLDKHAGYRKAYSNASADDEARAFAIIEAQTAQQAAARTALPRKHRRD